MSNYVRSFANVKLPSIESIATVGPDEKDSAYSKKSRCTGRS